MKNAFRVTGGLFFGTKPLILYLVVGATIQTIRYNRGNNPDTY